MSARYVTDMSAHELVVTLQVVEIRFKLVGTPFVCVQYARHLAKIEFELPGTYL